MSVSFFDLSVDEAAEAFALKFLEDRDLPGLHLWLSDGHYYLNRHGLYELPPNRQLRRHRRRMRQASWSSADLQTALATNLPKVKALFGYDDAVPA